MYYQARDFEQPDFPFRTRIHTNGRSACFGDLQLVVIRCILIMHEHDITNLSSFLIAPVCNYRTH